MLENVFGREAFDEFLENYFNEFAFQSMTTEGFLEYADKHLIQKYNKPVTIDAWVYGPGLPPDLVTIESDLFEKVDSHRDDWLASGTTDQIPFDLYSTHEKLHFVKGLPEDITQQQLGSLDEAFDLTASTNSEVQCVWYEKSIKADYEPAYAATESFLINVGRRKFLTPLYKAMKNSGKEDMALNIYEKARSNYHAVSTNTLDDLLQYEIAN